MKSRADIAEGKEIGVWFPPRNGNASLVQLTKAVGYPTLDADEDTNNSGASGDVAPAGESRLARAFD